MMNERDKKIAEELMRFIEVEERKAQIINSSRASFGGTKIDVVKRILDKLDEECIHDED